MSQVFEITSLTGTSPYDVYVCDVFLTNCIFTQTITGPVPPSVTISIPSFFEGANEFIIKIIDSLGCEIFQIIYCEITPTPSPTPTQTPTSTPTPTPTSQISYNCVEYTFCGDSTLGATFSYKDCYGNNQTLTFYGCEVKCVNNNFPISLISGIGNYSLLQSIICPTPYPTPTPTQTPTSTPTPTPTETPTPTPTETPTPTPTETPTPTPTETPTPTPTSTPTPTPTFPIPLDCGLSGYSFDMCSCPPGYTRVDNICELITGVLSGASGTTAAFTIGDNYPIYPNEYAKLGTFFYEDITNKSLPLTFKNNLQFDPITSAITLDYGEQSVLVDADNWTPSYFANYYGYNDVNISGNPITIETHVTYAPWQETGTYGNEDSVFYNSRFKTSSPFYYQWVGFSKCLNLPSQQQVHFIFGADDVMGIKLNGDWLIKRLNNSTDDFGIGTNFPYTVGSDGTFDRRDSGNVREITLNWMHCIPITLNAGENIFTIFTSDVFGAPTSACFEIYTGVTTSTLTGITTYNGLSGYTAFSTREITGTTQTIVGNYGDDYGIYCDVGQTLSGVCNNNPYCLTTTGVTC